MGNPFRYDFRLDIGNCDLWIVNGFRLLAVRKPSSIGSGMT